MCKDKNKQIQGIRSGESGMKEQTKIKIKDEATYLGKKNQYRNSIKFFKKHRKKGKETRTKQYKLKKIIAIISAIYQRGSNIRWL